MRKSLAMAFFFLVAHAQPIGINPEPTPLEPMADSNTAGQTDSAPSPEAATLEYGLGFRSMDYREELEAPLKSTENGMLREFTVHYRSPISSMSGRRAEGSAYEPASTNTQYGVHLSLLISL